MNKEKLKKIIKESTFPIKAKDELNQLVDEKKAKAKIEFSTLTELEKNKSSILKFLDELKNEGLVFKHEITGKSVIIYLLYQEFELKEVNPLGGEKPPKKENVDPKAKFKKMFLKIKLKLSKVDNKPVFNLFGGYFKFYTYLRTNFIEKLIELHPNEEEFERILDIIIKQALELNNKEKVDELFKGSLLQFIADKDNNFRKNIFMSAKKELFFRLDSRKNEFSKKDAEETANLFEEIFINSLKNLYGDQEKLLIAVLEAVDKVSDSINPKQAENYIKNIFPKIVSSALKKTDPLGEIKSKIEAL
ncbi:MAG: hypothetical protein WC356_05425 [Candidatus Micrarchaeia archaeon]|jgi:hypothetical protein